MNQSNRDSFPLPNRIVIFVLSSALAVSVLVALTKPEFRADLNIVYVLLWLLFFVMACAGVWFSLFARTRTPEELESLTEGEAPKFSDGALVCRYSGVIGTACSVVIDFEAGQIHFQNCHTPRRLLSVAEPWFSCPLDDLLETHRFRYQGESLTIVTRAGKALIPNTASNYTSLCSSLDEIIPPDRGSLGTEHPLMGMLYVGGAIAGLLAGWSLTPMAASDSTLALYVAGGAVVGVASAHCGVLFLNNLLNVSVVQPIGFGVLGAGIGLLINRLIAPLVNWATWLTALTITLGCIVGLGIGVYVKTQSRKTSEE